MAAKSKVAILRTKSETALEDYQRLFERERRVLSW